MNQELTIVILVLFVVFSLGFIGGCMIAERRTLNKHDRMKPPVVLWEIPFWFLLSGTITVLLIMAYGFR